jgi:hypothetical protein
MTTVDECLEYARECLRWAAEAKTEDERVAFFKMARVWTSATLRTIMIAPHARRCTIAAQLRTATKQAPTPGDRSSSLGQT